ncbi:unnamed protein product [Mycena citricolor]|uniref:G-patch domain-containing protein n=1 Tax=Mycena citricolor TaxID=2018698 RepID=A0AAD2HNF1_9AGAR|nr:unnamed protein product [Mycena citricolor]
MALTCLATSGASKGFGFAQFPSIEHARSFVGPQFPFIQVPPPQSHGASATAAFHKALETGAPHTGRRVKIDYSQSANPHDKGRNTRSNSNDGTRDIGNSPAAVLLFRGLDPLSGPQAIYQALLSSSGSSIQGAKGMKRILLIKDKVTLGSLGFAFVEFVDASAASIVLSATMSPKIHPNGFRISDRPVSVSFAHPYSFQPIADLMIRDDACISSSVSLGGEEGTLVRYWDESSTIAQLEFEVEVPAPTVAPTKEKKDKKKPKNDADITPRNAPAAPSVLPVSDKPVTLSFGKGLGRAGPVKPAAVTLGFSLDDDDDSPDQEEKDTGFNANKITPLIVNKKTANNINKWNQVQEELSSAVPSSSNLAPVVSPPSESVHAGQEHDFSDMEALACLLCSRQFKAVDQLKRHNKDSELHKARILQLFRLVVIRKNSQDARLCQVARDKLAARQETAQAAETRYRDRASERRILFNQPDHPVLGADAQAAGKKRQVDGPARAPSPPVVAVNPGKDDSNVGNKLLKMMGWSEGMGLGTGGEGRVDPIAAAVYAQGAGLGASKGKDITKITEATTNYAGLVKDSARERFGISGCASRLGSSAILRSLEMTSHPRYTLLSPMSMHQKHHRSPSASHSGEPSQTHHHSLLPTILPTAALVESVAGAAHYSGSQVEALKHRHSSTERRDDHKELKPGHQQVLEDIQALYELHPSAELFARSWHKDAVFEDRYSKCKGIRECSAQWYALASLFSKSETLDSRVMSSTHTPNRLVMSRTQRYKNRITRQTISSVITVDLDESNKIIRMMDQEDGSPLPVRFGVSALRRLNGRLIPIFFSHHK